MTEQRLIDADKLKQNLNGGIAPYWIYPSVTKVVDEQSTVDAVPISYIRKWIENHPTDYTTVESMITDWREEGERNE